MSDTNTIELEPEEYTVRGINVDALNEGVNGNVNGNGNGSSGHAHTGEMTRLDSEPAETVIFHPRQRRALDHLLTRDCDTMAQVAERAGVSPRTLYRYLQDPVFLKEYQRLCHQELSAHRGKVVSALIRGATRPSNSQPAMQRIYWERLGEPIKEHSENTNTNINRDATSSLSDRAPINVKRHICELFDALEAGEDMSAWVFHVEKLVSPRPALKLGPTAPRSVTPLEEIELHPAPGDV